MPALLQLATTVLITWLPPRAPKLVHPNATGCNIQTEREIWLFHLNFPSLEEVFPNKANDPHPHSKNRISTFARHVQAPIKPNQTHQTQTPTFRAAETATPIPENPRY